MIYDRLEVLDPEIDTLIKAEEDRQRYGLQLIASENYASVSVLQAGASVLANKYSEGQVGERYYGGNEYIDAIEIICKNRALDLFCLDPEIWDVNVQALSGTAANLAVYTGVVGKDGKIMGLDLASGGHLSHGYQTPRRKVSTSSLFFNSKQYKCSADGTLDYDAIARQVEEFDPALIICGGSAYPNDFDYRRLREIAGDRYLMMDMAHISGLIAAGLMNNPFEFCDIVTTTTHKVLRGPRSAMIFFRKAVVRNGMEVDLKTLIDQAVFPGLQGGPHNQKIAALAIALKQAKTKEYMQYARDVCENAQVLARELKGLGYRLYTGGTKCHMVLVCLENIGGQEVEKACEVAGIYLNKNCIISDSSPLRPSGIRLGTPALTTRGLRADEFVTVAKFVDEVIKIAVDVAKVTAKAPGTNKIDYNAYQVNIEKESRLLDVKRRVREFMSRFEMPIFNYRE